MRTVYTLPALALVAAAATGFATDANALLLTQGDAYYIGFVRDGEPADAPLEALRINSLLDLAAGAALAPCTQINETCDRLGSALNVTGFADANSASTTRDNSGSSTGIDVTGWTYLLGKYDGPNFGDLVWYVGGLAGTLDIQATAGGYGLSHYSLYNGTPTTKVPEPATTALFGAGLLALGFLRRRKAS